MYNVMVKIVLFVICFLIYFLSFLMVMILLLGFKNLVCLQFLAKSLKIISAAM